VHNDADDTYDDRYRDTLGGAVCQVIVRLAVHGGVESELKI